MLSRSLAILLASFLPTAALILPMGPAQRASALIAGTVATLLAGLSMAYDRARIGVAVIGGWVALSPFIFRSSLLEEVVAVCWGTMMFVAMAGPLSEAPRRTWTSVPRPQPEAAVKAARAPVVDWRRGVAIGSATTPLGPAQPSLR